MLIKWRTAQSRAAESRRLVGSLKLVYLPTYFPNAGMSIVVFDRLLYGHAEKGSLLPIDRHQLVRGGEVRKLQSIIGSNSHEISTCRRSGAFLSGEFLAITHHELGSLQRERAQGLFHRRCCHSMLSSRSPNTRLSSVTRPRSFSESISLLACSARHFQSRGWCGVIRTPF